VVLRRDPPAHPRCPMANALTQLEQVLNSEIAAEIRANRLQSEPKRVRAVRS